MELGTYLDLTSFIGEAFQYYRTWHPFTFMFWVGLLLLNEVLFLRPHYE